MGLNPSRCAAMEIGRLLPTDCRPNPRSMRDADAWSGCASWLRCLRWRQARSCHSLGASMRIYALTSQVIVGYLTPPLEYRNLEEAKPMNRQDVLMSTIAAGTAGAAIYDQSLAKPPGATGVAHTRKLQTSDGLSLFHREWGTGRSAVFVHSLALSSAMWAYQEEFLGSRGVR